MTIEGKVEHVGEEVVKRMYAAHKELKEYDPNNSLLSYLAPDQFGVVTLTHDIILINSFVKTYDKRNANPIVPILNYTVAMEKAIKKADKLAYQDKKGRLSA